MERNAKRKWKTTKKEWKIDLKEKKAWQYERMNKIKEGKKDGTEIKEYRNK